MFGLRNPFVRVLPKCHFCFRVPHSRAPSRVTWRWLSLHYLLFFGPFRPGLSADPPTITSEKGDWVAHDGIG